MPNALGIFLQPDLVWMIVAFIAAWLVLSCLKIIAKEADNLRRRHELDQHVRVLRESQQAQRHRASGMA